MAARGETTAAMATRAGDMLCEYLMHSDRQRRRAAGGDARLTIYVATVQGGLWGHGVAKGVDVVWWR